MAEGHQVRLGLPPALARAEHGQTLIGPLRSTMLRPGFLAKLAANGVELPPSAWLDAA